MKKLLALALAVCMMLGVVASAEGFTPAASYDVGERSFNAGSVTLEPIGDKGAGEEGKDYTDEKYYTYNNYISSIVASMDWNVQT